MTTLEIEILEKVQQLDTSAQRRLLGIIELEVDAIKSEDSLPADEWLAWAKQFGALLQEKYGNNHIDSTELLEEAREERLNDLMGGR
jgi:hypothetical protein